MAQFTISFTSDFGDIDRPSAVYSEENGMRFIDWLWVAYPQYEELPDENGNPIPLPDTVGNRAKSYRAWADTVIEDLKRKVVNHERHTLAEAARATVTEIE